ncbi:MAG: hypothetical protein AAFY26_19840 [Cyanobacteria bacterium J06638_22]
MQYGPGIAATFLYYFTSTAVIFTIVTAQTVGGGLDGFPKQVGLLGGIAGGLVGTYFNRTGSFALSQLEGKVTRKQLIKMLEKMGYELTEEDKDDKVAVYERTGASRFLSGKIFVQEEGKDTVVASRAIHLRALKRLLKAKA